MIEGNEWDPACFLLIHYVAALIRTGFFVTNYLPFLSFSDLISSKVAQATPSIRIPCALLADSAAQFLSEAIRAYARYTPFCIDLLETDYDQIELQVFDPSSELFKHGPQFILVFYSVERLKEKFYSLPTGQRTEFASRFILSIEIIYQKAQKINNSKLIVTNFPEWGDEVLYNFANSTESSFTYQLRKINYELMSTACKNRNLFINDIASLQNRTGIAGSFDRRMYVNAGMGYSLEFIPVVARNTVSYIASMLGIFKKCLILDLDNTLWGGVAGDVGWEKVEVGHYGIGKAYSDFQQWIKQVKIRGIILAACSKNNESSAREVFDKNPEMKLRVSDFAVFIANWNNKADNIRHIQKILNIGFDSIVFVDDNPAERELVRTELPQVLVPEMPEDPSEYVLFLSSLHLFETASLSIEDEHRTRQYQDESQRTVFQQSSTNEDAFLEGLGMIATVNDTDKYSIPRISQLTQRSNQFNLRTIRYSEEELCRLASRQGVQIMAFSLEDKFGDYGIISAIILERRKDALFIDTWVMSCRALKRGMEDFVCNYIVSYAKSQGVPLVCGVYIPTAKNGIVSDLYKSLGFLMAEGNIWTLTTGTYVPRKTFIRTKQ